MNLNNKSPLFLNRDTGGCDSRGSHGRVLLADILAMNIFFFIINFLNEVFIARMDLQTSLETRGLAALTNTITARPYGVWQDAIRRRIGASSSSLKLYLSDTLSFFTFQLPLYWLNLALAGQSDLSKIGVASLTVCLMAGLLGRPYGMFLDLTRKLFGCNITGKIDVDR